jgi:hypothetical protein
MPPDSPSPLVRLIRKLLPYTTALFILAVLYVVWVFVSRWNESRQFEREAAARQAKAGQELTEIYAGGQLKILNFYVTPGTIARGAKALICYGVSNAKTVRIDPAVERAYPSVSRCFEVTPRRDTRYTLTAEDGHGHTATASFVLHVK